MIISTSGVTGTTANPTSAMQRAKVAGVLDRQEFFILALVHRKLKIFLPQFIFVHKQTALLSYMLGK